MKKISTTFGLVLTAGILLGQQNMVMYNLSSLPQHGETNPAAMPEQKFSFSIPFLSSFSINLSNTGFRYCDLVRHSNDDSLYLDYENAIAQMHSTNNLNFALSTGLAAMQLKFKNSYIGISSNEKIIFDFEYNKELMDFIVHGNGAFLGEEINPSFDINFNHYREFNLVYGRKVDERLSMGLTFKWLRSLQNIQTHAADFSLYTNAESFNITAKPNLSLNTSGFGEDITKPVPANDYFFKKANGGFAMDAGVIFKPNSNFTFSAAVLDAGFINCKTDVTSYSNSTAGDFVYNGIDLNLYINDSTDIDKSFQQFVDSLAGSLNIDTLHDTYKSHLPLQTYLSTEYILSEKNKVSLLIHSRFLSGTMQPSFALGYTVKAGKWLEATANYSVINKTWNNFGIGVALRGNAVQYYIISENIKGVFFPHKVNNISLRFGFNFVFGN